MINSFDDYISAKKQRVVIQRTASITAVAANQFETFHLAGNPGAGTLAVGNTANGIVPTDETPGFPIIEPFDAGAVGYITGWEGHSPVIGDLALYDCLFKAGAYAYNANVTLTAQPSFASRVPDLNYKGLGLWLEAVTGFTGNQSIRVLYDDQDGNAGDTGVVATGVAPVVGRMFRLPLASGDSGLQKVNQVISSVSTAGTFNVLVLRPLGIGRIHVANGTFKFDLQQMGLPRIYDNSALLCLPRPDSTATSTPWSSIEISSK